MTRPPWLDGEWSVARRRVASSQKLVAGEQFGFNMPAGKSVQTACVWITLFRAFGGQRLVAAGRPTMDSPAAIKAIRLKSTQLGIMAARLQFRNFPKMFNSRASALTAQG